jgi:hypothetical protein
MSAHEPYADTDLVNIDRTALADLLLDSANKSGGLAILGSLAVVGATIGAEKILFNGAWVGEAGESNAAGTVFVAILGASMLVKVLGENFYHCSELRKRWRALLPARGHINPER